MKIPTQTNMLGAPTIPVTAPEVLVGVLSPSADSKQSTCQIEIAGGTPLSESERIAYERLKRTHDELLDAVTRLSKDRNPDTGDYPDSLLDLVEIVSCWRNQ